MTVRPEERFFRPIFPIALAAGILKGINFMAEYLRLKKSNCKNCYKCIRHCPVKAIRFSGNQAHIVGDECILCGQCFVVCPQGAKEITDEREKVKVLLTTNNPVIVSLAPSFAANYKGAGIEEMRDALKKLGFADVEETAIGATIVKKEYERLLQEGTKDVMITSCCHSVNLLIQKHFPDLLPCLLNVLTPMEAHCQEIKKRIPNAKTVFIGPCVAKKDEADLGDLVDAVMTFEELSEWLKEEKIEIASRTKEDDRGRARFFPTTGGILKSMTVKPDNYTYLSIDGTENCISVLKDLRNGNIHHCFIEMSACVGSCVGGPVMERENSPVNNYISISSYAREADFAVDMPAPEALREDRAMLEMNQRFPSQSEIEEILRRMGKTKKEDELNCGSCGYDTCRAKAVAIYQGKADVSMCLPFLKEKAENFSGNIINNTPNGIIVLNEDLEVQQVNKAALKIMNIPRESDVMGEPVVRILEPKAFMDAKNGKNVYDQKTYLAEYNRYVEQTVIFDKEYKVLIGIMRDITDQETEKEKKEEFSRQTIEVADNVVEKQMRIVQEIASLLGETAAETKIALTKLKESISDE